MRHRVKSTRLNRNASHLDSMLRNLMTSIVLYEKVKTTKGKAKMAKSAVEILIASAKKQTPASAMRSLNSTLMDPNASKKVVQELVARYKDRSSGFVRVTPLGFRPGDSAPVVQIELI